jgi:chromosome segregation ATPase
MMLAAAAAAAFGGAAPLHAQVQRSGGEAQRFMQQYQQVAAEKTALQAQVAQITQERDALDAELHAVKQERDTAKAHMGISPAALSQAVGAKNTAERDLLQSKQRMAELVARFRETASNLREVEADRAKLRKDLSDRNTAFDVCVADNVQLYDINREVLDRYEHVGLFSRASAAEPFTRITRTRLENLVDEYRERAQQLRQKKSAP